MGNIYMAAMLHVRYESLEIYLQTCSVSDSFRKH